jgi:hypothetical protein
VTRGWFERCAVLALLTVSAASAAEPAYYHPDDVARASAAFKAASGAMGPAFEERMAQVSRTGSGLQDLEVAVGMLGADAPSSLTDWVASTRRTAIGESMRLQRHADLLTEDYARVFGDALARALPAVGKGYAATECKAKGIAAMIGRTQCTGVDLNPRLAAAIDADGTLGHALADIATVEWPSLTTFSTPQAPIALTGTERWIDGGAVARAFVGKRVAAARTLATDAAEEAADGAGSAADATRAAEVWRAHLSTDGAALRRHLSDALTRGARKGGPAAVGWCGNPRALGGCAGEDVTSAIVAALKEDEKFLKGIARDLPAPE